MLIKNKLILICLVYGVMYLKYCNWGCKMEEFNICMLFKILDL